MKHESSDYHNAHSQYRISRQQFTSPNQRPFRQSAHQNIQSSFTPIIQHQYHQQTDNAFSHLRNQISTLRQEFSKLVEKDTNNKNDQSRSERNLKQLSQFYNERTLVKSPSHHAAPNSEYFKKPNDGVKITFQSKEFISPFTPSQGKSTPSQVKNLVEVKQEKRQPSNHIQGNPNSKSVILSKPSPDNYKALQELQKENLHLLKKNKVLAEQMNKIKEELSHKVLENENIVIQLKTECEKWKNVAEQSSISLSLKNNLMEKIESSLQKKTQEKITLTQQIHSLEDSFTELKQKHRQEIILLKQNFVKESSSSTKNIQEKLSLQYDQLYKKYLETKEKMKEIESKMQILHQQNTNLKQNSQKQREPQTEKVFLTKENVEELTDMRKRVEQYRKSVEQLNGAHNTTRQKLALANEEIKKLKAQNTKNKSTINELFQQNGLKQTLINSLYRDINILDSEMKQLPVLKETINKNRQSVDFLNQMLVELQCKILNYKYQKSYRGY